MQLKTPLSVAQLHYDCAIAPCNCEQDCFISGFHGTLRMTAEDELRHFGELKHPELTVGELIRFALPGGTRTVFHLRLSQSGDPRDKDIEGISVERAPPPKARRDSSAAPWSRPPPLPPDVFGVTGLLLDMSGATHHVCRSSRKHWSQPLVFDAEACNRAIAAGEKWRRLRLTHEGPGPVFALQSPQEIDDAWRRLWHSRDEIVFKRLTQDAVAPTWWHEALFLLVAADEAAKGYGFPKQGATAVWDLRQLFHHMLLVGPSESGGTIHAGDRYESISTMRRDVACVLPKSRTPQTGSTLRNLTHHLALLPARGLARAYWHMPPMQYDARSDSDPLNLLLVPFPFDVPPSQFRPDTPHNEDIRGKWGWFELGRSWHDNAEPEQIVNFVHDLAESAQRRSGPVHGIVLPESALSAATYGLLRRRVTDSIRTGGALSQVDFVLTGIHTDPTGNPCNVAATCMFYRGREGGSFSAIRNTQHKHHRWRLDSNQLTQYGLGSTLSLGRVWWEGVDLPSRKLNLFLFRRGAIFAPLICEDLARLEPVHELIRSVGPSLVVALLLDGAQISGRWPARYATSLADDPGSSVLTLTSWGLVARSSMRVPSGKTASRSVGLWRDSQRDTVPIDLPEGSAAVVLSVSGERCEEFTNYGRSDNGMAVRWRYADQIAIPFPSGSKFAPSS